MSCLGDTSPTPFLWSLISVIANSSGSGLNGIVPIGVRGQSSLVRASIGAVKRAVRPEGFNVGFNLGKVAGAGIAEHLHAHVVPRWAGDTNFMPVLSDTRVMPEHLDATWAKLRPCFEDVPGEKAPAP